jgi:hypothetical protein
MIEIIGLAVAVLGLFMAFSTYKKQVVEPDLDTKQVLLEKFDFLKQLNEKITQKLINYATENDKLDEVFMQDLTYRECINLLFSLKEKLLNEETEKTIVNINSRANINSLRLKSLLDNIEIQIKHHSEVDSCFTLYVQRYYLKNG